MKILVINCGSSSLKYQLIDMEHEGVVAKGLCERIGIEGSKLTHQPTGRDKFIIEKPMPNHRTAIEMVMEALQDPEHGVIKSTSEISAIGPPGTSRRHCIQRFHHCERGCEARDPRVLRPWTAAQSGQPDGN